MKTLLEESWWTLALRGVLAILFGILAISWPALTLRVLIFLFGAFVLLSGIFEVYSSLKDRSVKYWWVVLLGGVISVIIGILAFAAPRLTALVLLYLIAAWALITGILQIVSGIELRKQIKDEWVLVLCGIISVLFALFVFVRPGEGALALILVIGLFAIVFGILQLILAFKVRGWKKAKA